MQEAYRGCTKTIQVPRQELCPECSGSGAKRGSKPAMCRQCGGRGSTAVRMGPFQMSTTCNACGGTGAVITGSRLRAVPAGRGCESR